MQCVLVCYVCKLVEAAVLTAELLRGQHSASIEMRQKTERRFLILTGLTAALH